MKNEDIKIGDTFQDQDPRYPTRQLQVLDFCTVSGEPMVKVRNTDTGRDTTIKRSRLERYSERRGYRRIS